MIQGMPRRCLVPLLVPLLVLPAPLLAGSVLLFVGDGTGPSQVAAARLAAVGPDGRLAMDHMQSLALVTTHSTSGLTTDSAAGATALATGRKTANGRLSVAPEGYPLTTILERAAEAGYGTGLVTTTTLTHATPAAFASHVKDRGAEATIAEQMLETGVHVMMGGGRAFWVPQHEPDSKRQDGLDLLERARKSGYHVVETGDELRSLDPGRARQVLGLFAPGHLAYEFDRADRGEPSLAEMTDFAVRFLERFDKGFFLMVEGGRVDHACHNNDANRAIWEAIALDRAMARGLEFVRHREDVFVLFVADHETGGMSVANGLYDTFPEVPRRNGFPAHELDLGTLLGIGWTTGGHTGGPVLAAAAGAGAGGVYGLMDNTDLYAVMLRALGLEQEAAGRQSEGSAD